MILLFISAVLLFLSGFCFGRAYEGLRRIKSEQDLLDPGKNLWDAQ